MIELLFLLELILLLQLSLYEVLFEFKVVIFNALTKLSILFLFLFEINFFKLLYKSLLFIFILFFGVIL